MCSFAHLESYALHGESTVSVLLVMMCSVVPVRESPGLAIPTQSRSRETAQPAASPPRETVAAPLEIRTSRSSLTPPTCRSRRTLAWARTWFVVSWCVFDVLVVNPQVNLLKLP